MGVESHWTGAGAPAFDAVVEAVRRRRGGDPLAPVTVVTPTPAGALRLRRALARSLGGTAAVACRTVDDLARHLAAPRLAAVDADLDREVLVAAVRGELHRRPGAFGASASHRSTWETVAETVQEIATLPAGSRAALATGGPLPADVLRLHDDLAERLPLGGTAALADLARDRVGSQPTVLSEHGPVVVLLTSVLDAASSALLREVSAHVPVDVIACLSGDDAVDASLVASVRALGGRPPDADERPSPPLPTDLISANDVDDEVRSAVRALIRHAEAGVPLHTMALVHPAGEPYARAVADVLSAAGLPYSGPGVDPLAHTAPGRVLLGLLDVASTGFRREAVVDLWSSGLVVLGDGSPAWPVTLDRRSRRSGIIGGRDQWSERVAASRRWLDEHPVELVPGDPERTERRLEARARERAELDLLESSLAQLHALVDARPDGWDGLGDWAGAVLDTLCGPVTARSGWPAHEVDADAAVRSVLTRLSALTAIEPRPSVAVVVDTVRAVLDRPRPRRTGQGTGLLVTTVHEPPTVPVTAVAVVGLAEGHLPRVGRDDVLLPEDVRVAAGLPSLDHGTTDQRRALATALAAGTEARIVTYARCDQRSGRTQVPSRWFVDLAEAVTGERPRTEDLIAGNPVAGIRVVASHHDGLLSSLADPAGALHADEHRLAALAAAADPDAHPAALDSVLHAGATLARHRAADAFTRFDGAVGAGLDVLADDDRHLSPTGLEAYARCPRRWFLRSGLGLRETDRPEEVDRLLPTDKGTLAHRILERFIGEAVDAGTVPVPGERWGSADVARLESIAAEEFSDFERRGLTGHPRWWAFDRDQIVDVLRTTIVHDDVVRARTGARPVAVELTFGRDGHEPLRVELGDGRTVPLAGQADRVDVGPGGVHVYDYKYSSSTPYRGLDRDLDAGGDPLDAGRRLQLLTYAEAAASQRGIDRTSAWYWFLRPGHTGVQVGYEIGPEHRQMFRETLRVLVDNIAAGNFPAHSGPEDWFVGTNESCGYCEFDAICPADREDEWERVRADPRLSDLMRLADEGAPAFLVTREVA